MKRFILILFAALLMFVPVSSALALTVDLLSSTYNYDLYLESYAPDYYSDHLEGSSGLSSVEAGFSFYTGFETDVSAGFCDLNTWSDSVELIPSVYNDLLEGNGYAFVSGSWVFQPTQDANDLVFQHTSDHFDASYIAITDLTTGLEVYSTAWSGMNGDDLMAKVGAEWDDPYNNAMQSYQAWNSDFALNYLFLSDHVYELKMGTTTGSGGDSTLSHLSANITAVPEPSIIFLLIPGILYVYRHRNKSSKLPMN